MRNADVKHFEEYGPIVIIALTLVSQAADQGAIGTAVTDAYHALKDKISPWAPKELARFELLPISKRRQRALEDIINNQSESDKKEVIALANNLMKKLDALYKRKEAAPTSIPQDLASRPPEPLLSFRWTPDKKRREQDSERPSWSLRGIRFLLLILLTITFGSLVEHILSPDEREYLENVQHEAFDAVESFRPWTLISLFVDEYSESAEEILANYSPIDQAQYNKCMTTANTDGTSANVASETCKSDDFSRHSNLGTRIWFRFGVPFELILPAIRTQFFELPWPGAAILTLQIALALLMLIAYDLWVLRNFESRILYLTIAIVTLPERLLVVASVVAIPMWLFALIGLEIFGTFLSIAGLVTYACAYSLLVKLTVEKILDLRFHQVAEKLTAKIARP